MDWESGLNEMRMRERWASIDAREPLGLSYYPNSIYA